MKAALDPANTFAILIGMTNFRGFPSIPSAAKNVEGIACLLADVEVFGLPEKNIKKIIDTNSQEVKLLLDQYVTQARENGIKTLLIYYTGHGYRRTDRQYFLTAQDSTPYLINLDGSACISYEGAVKKILKGARIPQIFIVLDACYSGLAAQNGYALPHNWDHSASYTLTSSASDEESFFDATHDFTYFTSALIELLSQGLPNKENTITLADLYEALRHNIMKKGLKMSPQQLIGKQLRPHLYTLCKNKAFDPAKEKIQGFEKEINEVIEQIKKGGVKKSETYLKQLKKEIEQEQETNTEDFARLLGQVEEHLAFCEWYLVHEKTLLKEILDNAIHIKANAVSELEKKLDYSNRQLEESKIALLARDKELQTQKENYAFQSAATSRLGYLQHQKYLSALLTIVENGQQYLNIDIDSNATQKLKQLFNDEPLRILVTGQFNVGKSTFINAFIGLEVLPPRVLPSTAVITVLKYGKTKKAFGYYKDKRKTPMEIPIERLSDYLLFKDGIERNTPFSYVEVWWPLELLRKTRIEIIDSPGLNANVREDIIMDYLEKMDVVLFLMGATRFGPNQTELESINALKLAGCQDLFFIVNQFDLLRPHQQEEVKTKANSVLPGLVGRKQDIYFLSALNALEGRMAVNRELEQKSGFKRFEAELQEFLNRQRSQIKILRSARELKKMIREVLNSTEAKEQIILASHDVQHPASSLAEASHQEIKLSETKGFKAKLEQIQMDLEELINSIETNE